MDQIQTGWAHFDRIGDNIPASDPELFLPLEAVIRAQAEQRYLVSKFNVSPLIGGVAPHGDTTPIKNATINQIAYHDCMGGLMVSTRNSEINSRNIDTSISAWVTGDTVAQEVARRVTDKYTLDASAENYDKLVFIPGSNIFNTVDWNKVSEILIDHPTAMIKAHPVTTPAGMDWLNAQYAGRVIASSVKGVALLSTASMVWTTYNSEIGMICAVRRIPFGNLTQWHSAGSVTYSPIYRHFKYKDLDHNYAVMSAVLESPISGFVFPWQGDWEQRIESYFAGLTRFKSGLAYPYMEGNSEAPI